MKMIDEEKQPTEEVTTENKDDGDKPETTTLVDNANTAAERLEAANKKQEELLDRQEANYSKMKLGGSSEAGTPSVAPKVLTDTEYAEALQRGEVNPLKEDGIFK